MCAPAPICLLGEHAKRNEKRKLTSVERDEVWKIARCVLRPSASRSVRVADILRRGCLLSTGGLKEGSRRNRLN